jgi:uncharacterized protein (DUF1501 family)
MTPLLHTRREFLETGIKGLGLLAISHFVPSFVARTALASGAATDSKILVVIQLSGGNDGLNTVIPFADDLYHRARPTLAMRGDQTLKLNDHLGLHPALAPMKGEFDAGRVAIVENVGYPNPNRSHFRSMEIWHTGEDAEGKREINGWLGRYFDAQCKGTDPRKARGQGEIGVSFGKVMPQSFRNSANVGLALDNPDTFQWNASGETIALAKAQEAIFARLNQPGASSHGQNMRSLDALGGIAGDAPDTLNFLRHTAMNAVVAGDRIRAILTKAQTRVEYPDSQLARQLQMVSKLVAGGFPTRVYYAFQGGYDTHANQAQTHGRLLGDVAQSVRAFMEDIRSQKNVLAFSEFGRRVAENGSAGTDHGAAAPMFLFGEGVKGGIHGKPPDLTNLIDGDVRQQIDFRQVYASILDGWLETPSRAVLGREFEKIAVL